MRRSKWKNRKQCTQWRRRERFNRTQRQSVARQSAGGEITWNKIKGHLKTITEHKILVMKHCFRIGLYRQGLMHDLSKYTPAELLEGFRYYEDGKSSPNNGERRDKGYSEAWMHHKGRNRHHLEYWLDYPKPLASPEATVRQSSSEQSNQHGMPGLWNALNQNRKTGALRQRESYTLSPYPIQAVQMPRRYVAEMLMDRIAASENYNKESYTQHDALTYFEKGKSRQLMHPQTYKELHGMLRILDERGEDELVRFVKEYYLKGYPI